MPPSLNHTFYYVQTLATTVRDVNDKYQVLAKFIQERSTPIGPLCLLILLICLCACKPAENKGCCWPVLLTAITVATLITWVGWFLEDLWTQPDQRHE